MPAFRSVSRFAIGLIALLMLSSLYGTFFTSPRLTPADASLRQAQAELATTLDSLSRARQHIGRLQQQIAHHRRELDTLRARVQATDRHHRQQQARATQHRAALQDRWRTHQAERAALQQQAHQFTVE